MARLVALKHPLRKKCCLTPPQRTMRVCLSLSVCLCVRVCAMISSYGVNCSPEDPIPLNLIKSNVDCFILIWTNLINLSFISR